MKHLTAGLALAAVAAMTTPAGALPGNLSLEAYAPDGERLFADRYSYFDRVYTPAQARRLDRPTRRHYIRTRYACGIRLALSDKNLRMIRAHRLAGHRVLLKLYRGRVNGRRIFVSLCAVSPATLSATPPAPERTAGPAVPLFPEPIPPAIRRFHVVRGARIISE